MPTLLALFYLSRHRFWSNCWLVEASGGVVCIYRTMIVSFSGVVQQSLDDGSGVMDSRRVGALCSAMATLTIGLAWVIRPLP
jgi:hypothetical protein